MTEKLYYNDQYLKEFSAKILSVNKTVDGYLCTLDKSAFFPEEGGQGSDTGMIGDARVLYVFEKDGVIHHLTDKDIELKTGDEVYCRIDFDLRQEKMQIHTAEHLLCGIIHRRTGASNVGFHLGDEVVTFDIDKPLNEDLLKEVEDEANRAIYENRPVRAFFPAKDELESLIYRSKGNIDEGLRIVEIEGYDLCACCAPHAKSTGEIGIIKILSQEKHKGGTRIYMTAGVRAYRYLADIYDKSVKMSELLSTPVTEVDREVAALLGRMKNLEYSINQANKKAALSLAEGMKMKKGNSVVLLPFNDKEAMRLFVNQAREKVEGVLVAVAEEERGFKYVLSASEEGFSEVVKAANSALCGRGGGRGGMAEGTFYSDYKDIEKYFLS